MNKMITYRLSIDCKEVSPKIVGELLNLQKSEIAVRRSIISFDFSEHETGEYQDFVGVFCQTLRSNLEALAALGIEIADCTIWMLYAYSSQCNLEISAKQLKALSDLGLGLCISCWDTTSN